MGPTTKSQAAVWAGIQLQFLESERKRQAELALASTVRPRLVEATLHRSASVLAQNRSTGSASSARSPSHARSVSAMFVDDAPSAEPTSGDPLHLGDTVDSQGGAAEGGNSVFAADAARRGNHNSSDSRALQPQAVLRHAAEGNGDASVRPSDTWRRTSATFIRRSGVASPGPAPGTAAFADLQCKQLVQEIECRLGNIAQLDEELEALTQRNAKSNSTRHHPPVATPSSRLYSAQPRSSSGASTERTLSNSSAPPQSTDGGSSRARKLSPADVAALGNRLCPPLKDFRPPPPIDRTVRVNVKRATPAIFSDDTAMRLGSRDPADRRRRLVERIERADRDAKVRLPRCKEEDRQETCVRNYEAFKLIQAHRDAAEARVINTIDRTCNQTIPDPVLPQDVLDASVARLSRESELVRSRREKLIAMYADNYVAVGTAAAAHNHKAPLSKVAAARLFDGLSKGYDSHWRNAVS